MRPASPVVCLLTVSSSSSSHSNYNSVRTGNQDHAEQWIIPFEQLAVGKQIAGISTHTRHTERDTVCVQAALTTDTLFGSLSRCLRSCLSGPVSWLRCCHQGAVPCADSGGKLRPPCCASLLCTSAALTRWKRLPQQVDVEDFKHEHQLLSTLHHPNIVT